MKKFSILAIFVIILLNSCSKSQVTSSGNTNPAADTSTLLKSIAAYNFDGSGTIIDSQIERFEYDDKRRVTLNVVHIVAQLTSTNEIDSTVNIYGANKTETKRFVFVKGSLTSSTDNLYYGDAQGISDTSFSVDLNTITSVSNAFYDANGRDTLAYVYNFSGAYKYLSSVTNRYYSGDELDSVIYNFTEADMINKEYWSAGNLDSVKSYGLGELGWSYALTYTNSINPTYTNVTGYKNLLVNSTYTSYLPGPPTKTVRDESYTFDTMNRLSSMSWYIASVLNSKSFYTYY